MDFACKNCGNCCKQYFCFVNINDIDRWLDEDRMDIIACLTWQRINGRRPPDMLFIPKKRHVVGHSVLKAFYRPEWATNDECIFLRNGRCIIYNTRPDACRNFPKGKLDGQCQGMSNVTEEDKAVEKELAQKRHEENMIIYKDREMISTVIKRAKEKATVKKLGLLIVGIGGDESGSDTRDKKKDIQPD